MSDKISSEDIKRAIDAGEGLGTNASARYLFQFLAATRASGDKVDKLKGLASHMYVDAPTERNSFSTRPRKESDTRSKGDTRLAKLARGKGSFIPREAAMLHDAFVAVLGPEWGQRFSPEKLVSSDIRSILWEGVTSDLPWPEDLSSFAALSLLALSDSGIAPRTRIVDATRFNVMSGPRTGNADLYATERPHQLRQGDRVFLHAAGIPPETCEALVLIAADAPLSSQKSNLTFEILSFGVRTVGGSKSELFGPETGTCFEVDATSGLFGLGIVCSSDPGALVSLMPKAQNPARWDVEESRTFLRDLRKTRLRSNRRLFVAISPYHLA